MTVKELNVGDTFRVVGSTSVWRKWPRDAHIVKTNMSGYYSGPMIATHGFFRGKELEVVERAAEICRVENRLILRGGEVVLELMDVLSVHSCTPGDPHTEFALSGSTFTESKAKQPTAETILHFLIVFGHAALNRAANTELIVYGGRVYGRATKKDVRGQSGKGGYKTTRKLDGATRLVIVGVDTIPSEFALYDIIMEHFGPDTVPQA